MTVAEEISKVRFSGRAGQTGQSGMNQQANIHFLWKGE
jgi:hypothetical protein